MTCFNKLATVFCFNVFQKSAVKNKSLVSTIYNNCLGRSNAKNIFNQLDYSGTSNSGHFGGPSFVAVALEVTDVWRFYMNILFLSKRLVGRSGRGTKNDS